MNLSAQVIQDYHPTLLIGFGKMGISMLKKIMDQLPNDAKDAVVTITCFLDEGIDNIDFQPDLEIKLEWDDEQVGIVQGAPNYEWWVTEWQNAVDTGADKGRLRARMAYHILRYFYDNLNLTNFCNQIRQEVSVYSLSLQSFIFFSADEDESACVGDLTQEILKEIGSIPVLVPFCFLDKNTNIRHDQKSALLQELNKYNLKNQITTIGADWITIKKELFGHFFFIENPDYDLPLSQQVTALINEATAANFASQLANVPASKEFSIGKFCGITYQIPVETIRRACAAKLVLEYVLNPPNIDSYDELVKRFFQKEITNSDWRLYQLCYKIANGEQLTNPQKQYIQTWQGEQDLIFDQITQLLDDLPVSIIDIVEILIRINSILVKSEAGIIAIVPGLNARIKGVEGRIQLTTDKLRTLKKSISKNFEEAYKDINILASATSNEFSKYYANEVENYARFYQSLIAQLTGDDGMKMLQQGVDLDLTFRWNDKAEPIVLSWKLEKQEVTSGKLNQALFDYSYKFTSLVASNESILKYLPTTQLLVQQLQNTPSFSQLIPLPSPNRKRIKLVTGPSTSILNGETQFSYHSSSDEKKMTCSDFEFNLDVRSDSNIVTLLASRNASSVYPELINSKTYEQICDCSLPAEFSYLMYEKTKFEMIMWCVYFNWIQQSGLTMHNAPWKISLPSELSPQEIDFANSLAELLPKILYKLPKEDNGGINPFGFQNMEFTYSKIEKNICDMQATNYFQDNTFEMRMQERIEAWLHSPDKVANGLGKFQSHLLLSEKKRTNS